MTNVQAKSEGDGNHIRLARIISRPHSAIPTVQTYCMPRYMADSVPILLPVVNEGPRYLRTPSPLNYSRYNSVVKIELVKTAATVTRMCAQYLGTRESR